MEIEQKKSLRILPWLYIILLYLTPLYTFIAPAAADEASDIVGTIFFVAGILMYVATFIVGVINCIMAWVNCRQNREDYLRGCMVIMKYATIPFHVACAAMIFSGMMIFIFGGFVLIILGCILQASVFIVGICYAWSYMVVTVKNGRRPKEMAILHGCLLAVYVVDVVDTIVLMFKEKKYIIPSVIVAICSVIGLIRLGMGLVPR